MDLWAQQLLGEVEHPARPLHGVPRAAGQGEQPQSISRYGHSQAKAQLCDIRRHAHAHEGYQEQPRDGDHPSENEYRQRYRAQLRVWWLVLELVHDLHEGYEYREPAGQEHVPSASVALLSVLQQRPEPKGPAAQAVLSLVYAEAPQRSPHRSAVAFAPQVLVPAQQQREDQWRPEPYHPKHHTCVEDHDRQVTQGVVDLAPPAVYATTPSIQLSPFRMPPCRLPLRGCAPLWLFP